MDHQTVDTSATPVYSLRSYQKSKCFINKAGYLVHSVYDLHHALYPLYVMKLTINVAVLFIYKHGEILYVKDILDGGKAGLSQYPELVFEICHSDNEDGIYIKKENLVLMANQLGRIGLSDSGKIFYLEECTVVNDELDMESHVEVINRLKIMNVKETMQYILKHNCSVARFGDGEFRWMLMRGEVSAYQKNSKKLSYMLMNSLNSSSDNCLLCLPGTIVNGTGWWQNEILWYGRELLDFLPLDCMYGNALISRISGGKMAHEIFTLWKEMFRNRKIVIVEGEFSRLGVGNDLFDEAESLERILAPAQNAFEVYEKLLATICRKCAKDKLIVLALGPTATVLAPILSQMGYQAIDSGHVDIMYEWYKTGAEGKQQVKGKWVNEAGGMRDASFPSPEAEEQYLNQIIGYVI